MMGRGGAWRGLLSPRPDAENGSTTGCRMRFRAAYTVPFATLVDQSRTAGGRHGAAVVGSSAASVLEAPRCSALLRAAPRWSQAGVAPR